MEETVVSPAIAQRQETCTIDIYPNGTITDRGHIELQPWNRKPRPKKCRSAISTFSKASASRLRRLLAQTKGPEGWICFGVTLTVPGSVIDTPEWHRLWKAFYSRLNRLGGIALIWRIELQTREQPHAHCVCWADHKVKAALLREHWLETLDLLGPYEGPAEIKTDMTITHGDGSVSVFKKGSAGEQGLASVTSRRLLHGAEAHAVKIDGLDGKDKMGWWRYLAAHTSKAKQSQLGWEGRQWGKMYGRLLDLDEPVTIELPRNLADKVYRGLKRLTRSRYASSHGRQTWFVQPDTVKRLCDWFTGSYTPVRVVGCSAFKPFKKDRKARAKGNRMDKAGVPL